MLTPHRLVGRRPGPDETRKSGYESGYKTRRHDDIASSGAGLPAQLLFRQLDYGAKQSMPGDIDFGWNVEGHKVYVELKLLGQDKATRDSINAQLEDKGASATFLDDDTRDVARLQADLIQKASAREFNRSTRSQVRIRSISSALT